MARLAWASLAVVGAIAASCGGSSGDDLFASTSGAGGATTSSSSGETHASSSGVSSSSTSSASGGATSSSSTSGSGGSGGSSSSSSSSGAGGMMPFCGDGKKDAGEACDGSDFGTSSCTDYGYSSPAGLVCKKQCTIDASGCMPTCDGKLLEKGEICDGKALGGHDCTEKGYAQPDGLTCVACMLDFSGCQAHCGNHVLEPGEACDVGQLGGKDCTAYGYVNPNGLQCAFGCQGFVTSGCMATCGNNVVEPGEACDGNNLGGQDCTAFGFVNPAGLACKGCQVDSSGCQAVCGNHVIEPGEQCDDGNLTPNDGCSPKCQLEGIACANAIPITVALGPSTIVAGSTLLGGAHTGAGCAASAAPDRVYKITLKQGGFFTASLTRGKTTFDSVLYASATCDDVNAVMTTACPDSTVTGGGEVLSFRGNAGDTFYLYVDGVTPADAGDFELVLDLSTGIDCTDPVPIPIEPGGAMALLGNTFFTFNNGSGTCGGGAGDDVVYRVVRSTDGVIDASIAMGASDFNAVLYARSTCDQMNTELACSNNPGNGAAESISGVMAKGGVPVYVWVDGSLLGGGLAFGNYTLSIDGP